MSKTDVGAEVGVTPEDSLTTCPECERTTHTTWNHCPRCGASLEAGA